MATSAKVARANTPNPAPKETDDDTNCGATRLLHPLSVRKSVSFSPFLCIVRIRGVTEASKEITRYDQIFAGTIISLRQYVAERCMRIIKASFLSWWSINEPKELKRNCLWPSALFQYLSHKATVKPEQVWEALMLTVAHETPGRSRSWISPLTPSVKRPLLICTPPVARPQVFVITSSTLSTDSNGQRWEQSSKNLSKVKIKYNSMQWKHQHTNYRWLTLVVHKLRFYLRCELQGIQLKKKCRVLQMQACSIPRLAVKKYLSCHGN